MRARAPKEDPQAVADRNKARRQAELDRSATLQDDAATLTDEMRKIYGFRNLGRRGATVAAITAATAAMAPAAAPAPGSMNQSESNRTAPQTTGALARFDNGSPLAPATSPRPMPNPNYAIAPVTAIRPQVNANSGGSPLAPAKSLRPKVNPNQTTAPNYSRGTGGVTVADQGRAPAPTYSRASGGVTVASQGRAPAPTYSRASGGVKVTGTGRTPTKDKPKSGRI